MILHSSRNQASDYGTSNGYVSRAALQDLGFVRSGIHSKNPLNIGNGIHEITFKWFQKLWIHEQLVQISKSVLFLSHTYGQMRCCL